MEKLDVAKKKLGIKRLCLNCGKRFYDLQRDPIHCPSCGTKFVTNPSSRTRRQRSTVDKSVTTPEVKPEESSPSNDTQQVEETPEFLETDVNEELELDAEGNNVTEMLDGIENTKEENT